MFEKHTKKITKRVKTLSFTLNKASVARSIVIKQERRSKVT